MSKLLPYPHKMSLTEAFQANEMKFAFVNPVKNDFQMIHPYVKCREYFNELLMTNYHPDFQYSIVYGFRYNKQEFPLDLSATRIAIKFPNTTDKKTFIKNLPWIHAIEEVNKTDKSIIHEISNTELVIVGSKLWIQKCLLTNIYTLMLKLATLNIQEHTNKSLNTITKKGGIPSEIQYVQLLSANTVNNILENCYYIAEIPTKYVDGSDKLRNQGIVHESSGLLFFNRILANNDVPGLFDTFAQSLKQIFTPNCKNKFIKDTA